MLHVKNPFAMLENAVRSTDSAADSGGENGGFNFSLLFYFFLL